MKMFALRIPDDMRKKMTGVNINWAEHLRRSIKEVLESEKRRAMIRKFQRMTQDNPSSPSGTAVRMIRQLRDHG